MHSPAKPAGRTRCRQYLATAGLGLTALLLAGGSGPGCQRAPAAGTAGPAARGGPAPVRVAVAAQQDVPIQLHAIGRVEAYSTVVLKPQVGGQITEVHFTDGQSVRRGELLFQIDPRPYAAALRQAQANLARNTALAQDAAAEARREAELHSQGTATQREYEESQANAAALEAAVAADQAAVERAELDLAYCAITAPIDGRTGSIDTDLGNIVKANETELVTLNQVDPVYVNFAVPEQHLGEIRAHQAEGPLGVSVVIPPDDPHPEEGQLTFIDNRVDPATGMITLKATLANPHQRLWPGQFVQVTLTLTTRPGAVLVPAPAVQIGQAGAFVFVVRADHTVEARPVETGPALNSQVVLTRGLAAGETVVTDGQLRLVSGARVEVLSGAAAPTARASIPASGPAAAREAAP